MKLSQKHRANVVSSLARLGVSADDSRRFMRLGSTLHRLAEAQCSGYWPADDGNRPSTVCGAQPLPTYRLIHYNAQGFALKATPDTYARSADATAKAATLTPRPHVVRYYADQPDAPGCGRYWAPSSLRKTKGYKCPDCCASDAIRALAEACGLVAHIQGDPRGGILYLYPAGTLAADIESGRAQGGVYVA